MPPLDFEEIRRLAQTEADRLLNERFDSYLEMVRQVENLPENQSGADKTWVERASHAYARHYSNVVRVK